MKKEEYDSSQEWRRRYTVDKGESTARGKDIWGVQSERDPEQRNDRVQREKGEPGGQWVGNQVAGLYKEGPNSWTQEVQGRG